MSAEMCDMCDEEAAVLECAECGMVFCEGNDCFEGWHVGSRSDHTSSKLNSNTSVSAVTEPHHHTGKPIENKAMKKCDICYEAATTYCEMCSMFLCKVNGCDDSLHFSPSGRTHKRTKLDSAVDSLVVELDAFAIDKHAENVTDGDLNEALAHDTKFGHTVSPWQYKETSTVTSDDEPPQPLPVPVQKQRANTAGYTPKEGDRCDYCGQHPPDLYCQNCDEVFCKKNNCDAKYHDEHPERKLHFRIAVVVPSSSKPATESHTFGHLKTSFGSRLHRHDTSDDDTDEEVLDMNALGAIADQLEHPEPPVQADDSSDSYQDDFEESVDPEPTSKPVSASSPSKAVTGPAQGNVSSLCDLCNDEPSFWYCDACEQTENLAYFCTECNEDYHYAADRENHVRAPVKAQTKKEETALKAVQGLGQNKPFGVMGRMKSLARDAKYKVDDRKKSDVLVPEAEALHNELYDINNAQDDKQKLLTVLNDPLQETAAKQTPAAATEEDFEAEYEQALALARANYEAKLRKSSGKSTEKLQSQADVQSKREVLPSEWRTSARLPNTTGGRPAASERFDRARTSQGPLKRPIHTGHMYMSIKHRVQMRANGLGATYLRTKDSLRREQQARIMANAKAELRSLLTPNPHISAESTASPRREGLRLDQVAAVKNGLKQAQVGTSIRALDNTLRAAERQDAMQQPSSTTIPARQPYREFVDDEDSDGDTGTEDTALQELLQYRDPQMAKQLQKRARRKHTKSDRPESYIDAKQTDFLPVSRSQAALEESTSRKLNEARKSARTSDPSLRARYMTDEEVLESVLEAMLLDPSSTAPATEGELLGRLKRVRERKATPEKQKFYVKSAPTHQMLMSNIMTTFNALDQEFEDLDAQIEQK